MKLKKLLQHYERISMKLNNKILVFLIIGSLFHDNIYSKRVLTKNKNMVAPYLWFQIESLQEILEQNLQIDSCLQNPIQYKKLVDRFYFNAPEFSIAPTFPRAGYFDELFMLLIPDGRVQGRRGHILINNKMIEQFVWDQRYDLLLQDMSAQQQLRIQKVSGRVAVIAQFGYNNYFHFLNEILGRLALLEIHHIEYDWLYVPVEMPYIKELLQLWGVDPVKIISPQDDIFCLEADELIVPSLLSNTSAGHNHAGSFIHPITMSYVRDKLLKAIEQKSIDCSQFSKKIFISRKDAYASRRILNEDEIFALFKKKGFVRYELAKMSVAEQIMLFAQAEIVVGEQGSGLTNVLFCRPQTKVIELFQAMVDNCFWWQSYVIGLRYFPCLLIPVDTNYFTFCKFDMQRYHKAWQSKISIPIQSVQKIVENL
jgi:hypothetical protein